MALVWGCSELTVECVTQRTTLLSDSSASPPDTFNTLSSLLPPVPLPAVVGDVILVTLILVLTVKAHMIFPPSLKGFLFYIQTVYYVTEYFPISFWDIRKYVSS